MSLQRDVLANYASQIYVTVIGIAMVPLYVNYMGTEAYGLVGFFAMLQAWFQLVDVGLTPTMARETARFRGGGVGAMELRHLLRALEAVFVATAAPTALLVVFGSTWIASHWLKVEELPLREVGTAVMLMGLVAGFRWISGLYRGLITGFEQFVWLSGFNVFIATLRSLGAIPLFLFVGTTPTLFFSFQLGVAVLEVLVLLKRAYRLIPPLHAGSVDRRRWDWKPLSSVLRFSLTVAFTSSVWVLVTQTDKLILSNLLTLSDYAYFSLAVLVAGGILLIVSPISSAVMPRLARLAAASDEVSLISTYRSSTRLVVVVAVPSALVLGLFAEYVLVAWTGNSAISLRAAPLLSLYAIGNGVLAVAAFPYYLQFAKGDLRMHVIGSALFLLLLVPAIAWAANHFGAVGAGYVWVGTNVAYFALWIPLVHARISPGLHLRWLFRDVAGVTIAPIALAAAAQHFVRWPSERLPLAAALALTALVLIGVTFLVNVALGRRLAR